MEGSGFRNFLKKVWKTRLPGSWKIMCMEAEFVIETAFVHKKTQYVWNTTGYFHMQLPGNRSEIVSESGTGQNSYIR